MKLLLGVAFNTTVIYIFLIVLLRLVGRRTLAQLSALDLVVLILLGSAVETSMVQASTLLRCGFVSVAVLLSLNGLFTFLMRRSRRFRHLVGGGPILLIHNGHLIPKAVHRAGLTEADIMASLRGREVNDIASVRFAVMEPDGRINVVTRRDQKEAPAT